MKKPIKRAPKDLPPAVSDLVAEGGNVLAADDATVRPGEAAKPPRGLQTGATNKTGVAPVGKGRRR